MKRILLFICLFTYALLVRAQAPSCERTPEAEALKQTEMMRKDLNLTELQVDTVFKIHLYYAQLRRYSTTRAEFLQQLNEKTEALKAVLTEEQFQLFMNQVVEPPERRQTLRMVKTQ